jgi:DNA-binding transcriptional regulator YiaG
MVWTKKAARQVFGIDNAPMTPHELLAIMKALGDELRGDLPQVVFADLLGTSERTLRRYQHGERKIPKLVAREARRLARLRAARG